MFANCRGIPRQEIEQTVNEAIKNLNLDEYADKLCGSYSGGEDSLVPPLSYFV